MSRRWENEGRPLEDGRLCLVIDPEDGTHPLRVYGRDKDEVLDKAAKTIEHGSRAITALKNSGANGNPPSAAAATPPAPRRTLSADDIMQATADLANPATAPAATVRLVEHATGLDLTGMSRRDMVDRIATIAMDWQSSHPEFPNHPANKKMIMDTASLRVGFANITAQVLETVYQELLQQDVFVEPAAAPTNDPTNPSAMPPGETPASRIERPRSATSYRRTSLSAAPPAAGRTAKYTRKQIDDMNSDELAVKYRTEPGFMELVDSYATTRAKATA